MRNPSPSVRRSLQLLRVRGTHLYAHGRATLGFFHGLTRITNGTAAGTNRAPYQCKKYSPRANMSAGTGADVRPHADRRTCPPD
jgi:hypothetical protein